MNTPKFTIHRINPRPLTPQEDQDILNILSEYYIHRINRDRKHSYPLTFKKNER